MVRGGVEQSETEGIRKSENGVGREETTAFSLQIENHTDNPSVMLSMTAPFAQGSQIKSASPYGKGRWHEVPEGIRKK